MAALLEDKIALVTGAGRGLGAAIARGLAEAGAEVILADLNGETLTATVAAMQADGLRVWAEVLDVTDRAAVGEMLAFAQPGRFAAHPISPAVGATRNNGPGLLEPLSRDQLVGVVDPETGEVINGG